MEQPYYGTEDFGFACYLKMSGVDLREVKVVDDRQRICEFVFRIKEDSEKLAELFEEWSYGADGKQVKRILYASRHLKKALKTCLTEHERDKLAKV